MILEFKTKGNNTYGRRRYLAIDTEKGTYTTESPRMIVEGVEISTRDYKAMIEEAKKAGYNKV
jgi:hypothetical protein